ncbi:triose-phosphate isomerase [Candidatus Omnitrophota bacterium]
MYLKKSIARAVSFLTIVTFLATNASYAVASSKYASNDRHYLRVPLAGDKDFRTGANKAVSNGYVRTKSSAFLGLEAIASALKSGKTFFGTRAEYSRLRPEVSELLVDHELEILTRLGVLKKSGIIGYEIIVKNLTSDKINSLSSDIKLILERDAVTGLSDDEFNRVRGVISTTIHHIPDDTGTTQETPKDAVSRLSRYQKDGLDKAIGRLSGTTKEAVRTILARYILGDIAPKVAEGELKRIREAGIDNEKAQALVTAAGELKRGSYAAVFQVLSDGGIFTILEISKALVKSYGTVENDMAALKRWDLVIETPKAETEDNRKRYQLTEDAMRAKAPLLELLRSLPRAKLKRADRDKENPKIIDILARAREYPSDNRYLSQMAPEEIKGKTFLVRADYNVPRNEKTGEITDDTRIKISLPTIEFIRKHGGKTVLMTHIGRPTPGKPDDKSRLDIIAEKLRELDVDVVKLDGETDEKGENFRLIGESERETIEAGKPGDVFMLENTRIDPREKSKDPEEVKELAKEIASLGNIFVLDGFAASHRGEEASVGVVPEFVTGVKGLLIEEEETGLKPAIDPTPPLVPIFGGSKIADKIKQDEDGKIIEATGKIEIIRTMINKVGRGGDILIAGAMAYPFLKALGKNIGDSGAEDLQVQLAEEIIAEAEEKGVNLHLPIDHLIAREFDASSETSITDDENIPDGWIGVDIGPKTVELFEGVVSKANTVLWNGPLGAFDRVTSNDSRPFAEGTFKVAKLVGELTEAGQMKSIVGGGETNYAMKLAGVRDKITFASSGGGAYLQYIVRGGESSAFANLAKVEKSVKFPAFDFADLEGMPPEKQLRLLEERAGLLKGTQEGPMIYELIQVRTRIAGLERAIEKKARLQRMAEVQRRPVIGGNWKMEITSKEAAETLVRDIVAASQDIEGVDIVVASSGAAIDLVKDALGDEEDFLKRHGGILGRVKIGAQNVHWEDSGAFTGEESPLMLKNLGVEYVIVGHSERRHIFGETDEVINKKVKAVLKHGMIPIVCIGETVEERERGKTFEVLKRQIRKGLEGLGEDEVSKIVVAYEPVWAIGTGKTATDEDANGAIEFIRLEVGDMFSDDVASLIPIQYGGSVKPGNIDGLIREPHIDGALVGGDSLKAETFVPIAQKTAEYVARREMSKRHQALSMNKIIAVFASKIISDKEGFKKWISDQPKEVAVVILAMDEEEYSGVKEYKDIAFIKVVGKDIGEEHRDLLNELFSLGDSDSFGSFYLGDRLKAGSDIKAYRLVIDEIASGV